MTSVSAAKPPLVTFAAAAVGFACYVLSRLVLDAAVLREENDMTI